MLNNLNLKADAEYAYLAAIVEYNKAHFELYVALGQPPAACLARPVPTEGVTRTVPEPAPARPGPSRRPSPRRHRRRGRRSLFSPPLPSPSAR